MTCGEKQNALSLLEGEGVVVLAGLAVPDQVASLFAQPEQGLCICPADRAVVPAAAAIGKGGKGESNAVSHACDFNAKLQSSSTEVTLTTGSPEAWTGLCAQPAKGCSAPATTFWCSPSSHWSAAAAGVFFRPW